MVISATDFQLRVNEYFTKIIKGKDVVIERYGEKFAVLISYEKYKKIVQENKTEEKRIKVNDQEIIENDQKDISSEQKLLNKKNYEKVNKEDYQELNNKAENLTSEELRKLLRILLLKD